MKQRWIIAAALVTVLAAVGLLAFFWPNAAQRDLDKTRRDLRQGGFQIDLSEFNFSASADERVRATALTNANLMSRSVRNETDARRNFFLQERFDLMPATGPGVAIVLWQQPNLPARSTPDPWASTPQTPSDLWATYREALDAGRIELDQGCAAALKGPIRFDLAPNRGVSMLLPHLANLRGLSQTLGVRTLVELHDGHRDLAWTNVLAVTRLATAWEPESTEISQLVRCGLATLAFETTWQALMAGGWSDAQLAQLQAEWQAVDFFKHLPETEAFARAAHADACQRERQDRIEYRQFFRDVFRSPRTAWMGLSTYWSSLGYRRRGSYEDERDLLLYHRDRELQLRAAIAAPTWQRMRQMPGVTNSAPYQARHPSRVGSLINMRQMSMGFMRQGRGLMGQAADAEARRRLLLAALALERYHTRHGNYPPSLTALVPGVLPRLPVDFMDGQPLRYRRTEDGRFVLYSVGLDCVDNGGEVIRPRRTSPYGPRRGLLGFREGSDVVWARPASAQEIQAHQQEEETEIESQLSVIRQNYAEVQRRAETERTYAVNKLLAEGAARRQVAAAAPKSENSEPNLLGRPFRRLLRNLPNTETNAVTLGEMLTPRPVPPVSESGVALFEVPVSYDAVTNNGFLHLIVDGELDTFGRSDEGERQTCERAANGNCLLGWTSTYDPPGQHAIQAEFIATTNPAYFRRAPKARGPAIAFVATNLCQFDSAYDQFDTRGGTLYARLVESNAVYAIELKAPGGERLRTFTGTTSNGVIQVHWDLLDDRGTRSTNPVIESVFKITLPASGRSQTVKGP